MSHNHNLPEGWIAEFDQEYKTYFFVNQTTGVSQWEKPTHPATRHNESDHRRTHSRPNSRNEHEHEHYPQEQQEPYLEPSHSQSHSLSPGNHHSQPHSPGRYSSHSHSPSNRYQHTNGNGLNERRAHSSHSHAPQNGGYFQNEQQRTHYPNKNHKAEEGLLGAGAGAIGATILHSAFKKHENHNQPAYGGSHQGNGGIISGLAGSLLSGGKHSNQAQHSNYAPQQHQQYGHNHPMSHGPQYGGVQPQKTYPHHRQHGTGIISKFAESIMSAGTGTYEEDKMGMMGSKRHNHNHGHEHSQHQHQYGGNGGPHYNGDIGMQGGYSGYPQDGYSHGGYRPNYNHTGSFRY